MKKRQCFSLSNGEALIESIENLARQNQHCMILDSNAHADPYGKYDYLLAWGAAEILKGEGPDPLQDLQKFREKHQDWLFGHLSFDLKNKLENLKSRHPDIMAWSDLQFFIPETVVYKTKEGWQLESYVYPDEETFLAELSTNLPPASAGHLFFEAQSDLETYLKDLQSLKEQLQYGNIYEINYCTLFMAQGQMDPYARYQYLKTKHHAPFEGYYRDEDRYLLCFSPERYLRKKGAELISQPIKGTSPRDPDPVRDSEQKAHLLSSEKERAENVMIVDLVRNDLSRTAKKNSVSVPELFGLYSFKAVHQMISTVRSELDDSKYSLEDAIRYSFPMGSMTGAPKISALQLIDSHEHFRRGLYSGSIGYIDPHGDFDFNVVIRSIQYHHQKEIALVGVGSAITIHCDPEAEYEECLLKAEKVIG